MVAGAQGWLLLVDNFNEGAYRDSRVVVIKISVGFWSVGKLLAQSVGRSERETFARSSDVT